MRKPDLSAVLVCFRSQKYLGNCARSLKKSAEKADLSLEIIIVINDGHKKGYDSIKGARIFHDGINHGYAEGINLGTKLASGKWLVIVNPDTETDPAAFRGLKKYFPDKHTAIVGPKIINPGNKLQLSVNFEPSLWNIFLEQSFLYKLLPFLPQSKANPVLYSQTQRVEAVEGTYFAVRKDVFHKIGGMDNRFFLYFEDLDLCRRVRKSGYRIIFDPEILVFHYGKKSSGGVTDGAYYLRSLYKYLRKYHGKTYAITAIRLLYLGSLLRLFFWKIRRGRSGNRKMVYLKKVINEFHGTLSN